MTNARRIALGTVQWGVDGYGIANRTGTAAASEVSAMLAAAAAAGVDTLDTASAYGRAEQVVGELAGADARWRIVTKLAPDVWAEGTATRDALAATRASLERSCHLLRRDRLDVLLLHRPVHRTCCGGALWELLRDERDAGRIGALGISALTPEDAELALADPDVEVLQVAGSLLDQRLARRGVLDRAAAMGREVHLRSTFLQGVAFLSLDQLPAHLEPARAALRTIDDWACTQGVPRHVAFLAFAASLPVERLVLGCERMAQLEDNLACLDDVLALSGEVRDVAASVPDLPAAVLDPSRWTRRRAAPAPHP